MGQLDTLTKQYLSRNDIFADICNFYLYDGNPVIKPEQLHPLDPNEFAFLQPDASTSHKKQSAAISKQRDVLKHLSAMTTDDAAYLIIGIENQSDIHYAMPVRNMLYDALQYHRQMQEIAEKHRNNKTNQNFTSGFQKEDELIPVITIVVYFGAKPWDGAMSLHEMMPSAPPELLQYVADYPLLLIDPHRMQDDTANKLQSNAREIFTFIKYAKDKDKLLELLQKPRFHTLDPLAAEIINQCTHSQLPLKSDTKGEIDMCQAIDEIREDSRNEGRDERSKEMAVSLLKDNIYPLDKISTLTKLPMAEIHRLQQELIQA